MFSQKVRVLLKKLGEMRKSSSYRKKFTQGTDKIVRPNETFEFPSIRVIESQLYSFSFHQKQCASEKKDFTLLKFTSYMFSNDVICSDVICFFFHYNQARIANNREGTLSP